MTNEYCHIEIFVRRNRGISRIVEAQLSSSDRRLGRMGHIGHMVLGPGHQRSAVAELPAKVMSFRVPATSLPLRFLILNILSVAGVEISAGSSVRGLGVRFHTSDIRRETSLNGPFYRVGIQLVCDGH